MKSIIAILIISIVLTLAGCDGENLSVKIGYKGNTEQLMLANIFAEMVEKETKYNPILVEHKSSVLGFEALKAGKIDFYLEYTRTLKSIHLKEHFPEEEDVQPERLIQVLADSYDIIALKPLDVDNAFRFAITKEDAKEKEIETVSDLEKVSKEWKLGATSEFIEREDGYAKFIKDYGFEFLGSKGAESELRYMALETKDVNVVQAYVTDAYVVMMNLLLLEDDKKVFKEVSPMPILNGAFAKDKPEVVEALKKLEGKISTEDLLELNILIDEDKKNPREMAEKYLKEKGIVK